MLSPRKTFDLEIIRTLYKSDLLVINPQSELDAIELDDKGGFRFYLDRVSWLLPLSEKYSHAKEYIEELERTVGNLEWNPKWYDEVEDICRLVALEECLAFLEEVIQEHKLSFTIGEKTNLVISNALRHFSVAQVYNFIWRAGKDAAAFYMRSNVPKKHAANTVVGSIQKQYERALANSWDVKAFRRNYSYPQSILSQVLFNTALHTDDGGFHELIDKVIPLNKSSDEDEHLAKSAVANELDKGRGSKSSV